MASKNIKGITIEIGGNTTKLQNALKDVDSVVYKTNTELKSLNQALKLDPKNTELLAQKQDVLKKNIAATTERLNTLKEAQRQMGSYNSLTDEQKENYRALSVEIAKSESALNKMNKELKTSSGINLDGLKEGLKKVGDVAATVAKKMAEVSAVVGGALAAIVGAGVKSYSQFEQLEGGAKLLFGTAGKSIEEYAESVGKTVDQVQGEYDKLKKAEDTVMENSKRAYETMGLSANQYLEQVNSYAVGLKTYLNGDSQAAAELADKIMTAQADIVAATGNTQEAVENAFRGVMRGNYTMLDNLQLGITPTKEGFQQVIDKVNEWNEAQGKATSYQLGNYADMESALVDYVEMQGLAGYAANEAAGTITGSVSSMKAAFDNFLNGSGSPEDLAKSITNVLKNISDAIVKLAPNILNGIVSLVETLVPQIGTMLVTLIPQLLDAITNMIDSLLNLLTQNTDGLQQTITMLINKAVEFITTNLPKIIQAGLTLIVALAKGIAESIPTLIPTIIDCIMTIVQTLLDNLPQIIEAGIQLLISLIQGIVDAIPMLIDMLPTIIETIVEVLIENLPLIINAAIEIMIALINGLIVSLPKLVAMIPKITMAIINGLIKALPQYLERGGEVIATLIKGISSMLGTLGSTIGNVVSTIINGIKNLPGQMVNWGKDMIQGLVNGIKGMIGKVGDAVKGIANKIKNFLHFSRPDVGPLRDYEEWMPDFVEGLASGIKKSTHLVQSAVNDLSSTMSNGLSFDSVLSNVDMAMKGLNTSVKNSINPVINPNVTYESNYNMLAQAVKEALSGMTVELDEDPVGKFVIKKVTDEIYS